MRTLTAQSAVMAVGVLAGCASFTPVKVVGEPSEVTIEQALVSVGNGLTRMRDAIGTDKTGLIPAEVTVTFKLAASAKDSGKLTVDLSVPITSGGTAGTASAGGEATQSSEGSRSNEITIKFVNLLVVPTNTLATAKDAKQIDELIQMLMKHGITTMFTPVPAVVPR